MARAATAIAITISTLLIATERDSHFLDVLGLKTNDIKHKFCEREYGMLFLVLRC
jgi:hypothetical protein